MSIKSIIGNYRPEDLTSKQEPVLIGLLKELAVLFPEKWSWNREGFWLHHSRLILETYANTDETLLDYSTEDCDAVLAEHEMIMGITWEIEGCGLIYWYGEFGDEDGMVEERIFREDKRSATEATFNAALEYIIKQEKSQIE